MHGTMIDPIITTQLTSIIGYFKSHIVLAIGGDWPTYVGGGKYRLIPFLFRLVHGEFEK
jgi:hypothetical protein